MTHFQHLCIHNYHVLTCDKTTPLLSQEVELLETWEFKKKISDNYIWWIDEETKLLTFIPVQI